jgi:hypothetical protein
MARDGHDCLFTGLRFSQFGDGVMTQIVKTQLGQSTLEFVNICTARLI